MCWKVLAAAWTLLGKRTTVADLDPKAVTTAELYGTLHPSTREWREGIFSHILREFATAPTTDPKWIVLDGDVDPLWIESLNSLMDDNRVCCSCNCGSVRARGLLCLPVVAHPCMCVNVTYHRC